MVMNVGSIVKQSKSKTPYYRRGLKESAGVKQSMANLDRYSMGSIKVTHVYSLKSKVVRSIPGMRAVKVNRVVGQVANPEFFTQASRGWIKSSGELVTEHEIKMNLRSLDHTTVGWGSPVSLEETYEQASPEQKAKMAEIISGIDWDEFWKEYYPKEGRENYDKQADMYDAVVTKLMKVLR